MGNKIYLQNFNDGVYKRILEKYICNGCGIPPHYVITATQGSKVDIAFDGWGNIDGVIYCPMCMRREKIKKILNG